MRRLAHINPVILAEQYMELLQLHRKLQERHAKLFGALEKIANRSDLELLDSRTLHYDMRGWAATAINNDMETEKNEKLLQHQKKASAAKV
jgi:hypothetical protein